MTERREEKRAFIVCWTLVYLLLKFDIGYETERVLEGFKFQVCLGFDDWLIIIVTASKGNEPRSSFFKLFTS